MDDRLPVSVTQVAALVAGQFPQWAALPVRPVDHSGWDNRSFRLGETMLVRMPSAERYVSQIEKEHVWLPKLARALPVPIPVPLARGKPGEGYPFPWSVYRWLEGEPLIQCPDRIDLSVIARDVASFLSALHAVDASDGPPAGDHNFHRGGSLRVYDDETRQAILAVGDEIDPALALNVWELALSSHWQKRPVWVHGDIAEGNLLVASGRLVAVIDFGTSGVGDPSSDLVPAWNVFDRESRTIFRDVLGLDEATWQRGRGWALWKALITLTAHREKNGSLAEWSRRTIRDVFDDHLMQRFS